jgi:hypothetical protein
MTNFRGILTGAAVAFLVAGVASADQIDSVSAIVSFATDGTYTLTLNDFNSSLGTLTGATLYLNGTETVNFGLNNTAPTTQVFDVDATSNIVKGFANTASATDVYSAETLDVFDTGIGPGGLGGPDTAPVPVPPTTITLGGLGAPGVAANCPVNVPSATCSAIAYSQYSVSNIRPAYGFASGTGLGGVDGVILNLSDLSNYIGAGTFALSGGTKSNITFQGGGNNIGQSINTTAAFQAEIDYTYTVPGTTPEPATFALFSGALLAIGLYRKKTVR